MKAAYEFQRDVVVSGRAAAAGHVWEEDQFPPGSLQPCLRCGHVLQVPAENDRRAAESPAGSKPTQAEEPTPSKAKAKDPSKAKAKDAPEPETL